ncbi:MAG TPA: class I SAM-dependent methyltransferase [Arsenicitalea sp.]|jgi:hypothetical protein|nr:class I SAM-dependent methyltransferase [Arsenicitalea sp.]
MSLVSLETAPVSEISPDPIVNAILAYHSTAAIKAAIGLDLFTAIGSGSDTPEKLATKTGAAERGLRILCDFLTVHGFLSKGPQGYGLTPSTEIFLDRRSPAYMGDVADFLAAPESVALYLGDPQGYVRNGGSAGLAIISPDNPVWVKFAEVMVPFVGPGTDAIAAEVSTWPTPPRRVLDIAAGHGMFGIAVAKVAPQAEIVALDSPLVLELAQRNAEAAGVAERFTTMAGSAFELDWGSGYDLILLPNFLHHFDRDTCVGLLRKVRASLSPDGQAIAVEFVPNEDRVSPPFPAHFAFMMLASTPQGDAYTASDLRAMATDAGFTGVSLESVPPSPASLVFFER